MCSKASIHTLLIGLLVPLSRCCGRSICCGIWYGMGKREDGEESRNKNIGTLWCFNGRLGWNRVFGKADGNGQNAE